MKTIKFLMAVLSTKCTYRILAKKEVRNYLASNFIKQGKKLFLKT